MTDKWAIIHRQRFDSSVSTSHSFIHDSIHTFSAKKVRIQEPERYDWQQPNRHDAPIEILDGKAVKCTCNGKCPALHEK